MGHLNDLLFLLINAGAHPPEFLLSAALFLATWLVPLAILVFVLLWIRKGRPDRIGLISATITMLIALGVNQIIGLFYFHPRPFMIGLGHQYLPHPPDNSFPSDHATFLWSLGFALLALGALRAWAALLVMAGFAVAWARVYVGVHFPFDMAGSMIVALGVTRFTKVLHQLVQRWLGPFCVELYEWAVCFCHLPAVLFPRQTVPLLPSQREASHVLVGHRRTIED